MAKDTRSKIATKELTRILERDGYISASTVLNESRPKNSPLHGRFEWNNAVAGEAYRMHQSRNIIRVEKVVVKGNSDILVHVPVVQVIDGKREGRYVPSSVLVTMQDELERAMVELLGKVNGIKETIHHIQNLTEESGGKSNHAVIVLQSLAVAENALKVFLKPS